MSSKQEVQASAGENIAGRKSPAFSTVSVQDAIDESAKETGAGDRRQSVKSFFDASSNSLLMQTAFAILGIGLAALGYFGLHDHLYDHFKAAYGAAYIPYSFVKFSRQQTQDLAPLPEFFRWLFFALLAGGSYVATHSLIELIPRIVSMMVTLPEAIKVEMVYFHRLSRRFAYALAMCVLMFVSADCLSSFQNEPEYIMDKSYDFICKGLITFFAMMAVLLYLRKLLVQRIAISYHAFHYADRVQINNARVGVLNTLKKYVLECVPYDPQLFEGMKLDDTLAIFSSLKEGGPQGKDADAAFSAMLADIEAGASDLSKAIVKALRPADRAKNVTVAAEDFLAVFQEGAAKEAFDLLDADGNGDLTIRELRAAIVEAFQERLAILRGLTENEGILEQLDAVFAGINWVANVYLFMSVFQYNVVAVASLVSLLASFMWIFSPVISSVFNSIMFIFVNHPYDAGDRIEFDGNEVTVVEISLQTSTFRMGTGEIMYCSNGSLVGTKIKNLRRSGNQTELLKFSVSGTPESLEKMKQLKEKLQTYFAASPRDYVVPDAASSFFRYAIKDFKSLEVHVDVEFRGNFQDSQLRALRKNKFAAFFAQTIKDLHLGE